MKQKPIKNPIRINVVQDYAQPYVHESIGHVHENKQIEALFMVRALNDMDQEQNKDLFRKFYYTRYESNGKVTILVPRTGEGLRENVRKYTDRIAALPPCL